MKAFHTEDELPEEVKRTGQTHAALTQKMLALTPGWHDFEVASASLEVLASVLKIMHVNNKKIAITVLHELIGILESELKNDK